MPFFSYILQPALDASANAADPLTAATLATIASTAARDLALDPLTGDLEVPLRILQGADAVLQRVWIRLRMFLGEWFLDQRIGVPWRERILIKGADIRDVRQILTRVVEGTPGVARVETFDCTLNARTRELTVSTMTIVLTDGSTVVVKKQEAPFFP